MSTQFLPAPKGQNTIAQGETLGQDLFPETKPRRGATFDGARVGRPCGALRWSFRDSRSQGFTLGYRMRPRWGQELESTAIGIGGKK